MKIYFHIGAGKCGSSALQEYFSYNNSHEYYGFLYGAVAKNGSIAIKNEVENRAQKSPYNYCSSCSLITLQDEFLANFKSSLLLLSNKCDTLLLSNEGWINESDVFHTLSDVLNCYECEVIMLIRPPVLWLNSAWWQWGAWSNVELDLWLSRNIKNVCWSSFYDKFQLVDFIKKVHVIPLSNDIVNSVNEIVSLPLIEEREKSNVSSGNNLLRFFELKRTLRPSPHHSNIEFALNRYVKNTGKPDWVISRLNITKILKRTYESNLKLLENMSNSDKELVLNDNSWWGKGYYAHYDDRLRIEYNPSYDELSGQLEEAYQIIFLLDKKIRDLHD